jgi:hypothetical protein
VIFWMAGAMAIWWLVTPAAGWLAGLASVGVFLFVPFGVPASQAFQPEPSRKVELRTLPETGVVLRTARSVLADCHGNRF